MRIKKIIIHSNYLRSMKNKSPKLFSKKLKTNKNSSGYKIFNNMSYGEFEAETVKHKDACSLYSRNFSKWLKNSY